MDLNVLIKGKKLTDNELQILDYLLANTAAIDGLPLREIAKAIYTSPATIVRLAQKLGFSGYLELLYFLKNRLKNQTITEAAIDYQIDAASIADTIDAIKEIYGRNKHKFITIYATGFSGIVAEYLHKKMLVNGIKTLLVSASDSGGIISNNIENISMLITISKSGETQKVLEKMALANEHHIPTVLFCGNGDHRANQLATFSFEVTDERPYDTQNIQYTSFFGKLLLLMEYIVDDFTHVEKENQQP
ncbi:MurR/RpiR family transcriptional regulator [Enterococcus casseliflavus]|uniref:MurR/RpiR family transcriptional regulator n=1 Tax=Enterococcus casseliflavus TaxID=37734 RepID=UPI000F5089E8|nr:MurR/RpiR family transcriptional regulator [Enterococcus casseliflavus]ROY45573.1 MurR/RpiR family transcriptional regulator [Enterococcus casseliflavus]